MVLNKANQPNKRQQKQSRASVFALMGALVQMLVGAEGQQESVMAAESDMNRREGAWEFENNVHSIRLCASCGFPL